MADFYTKPTFTHGFVPLGQGAGGVNLLVAYKTYSTGADPFFSQTMVGGDPTDVPYGLGMEGETLIKTTSTASSGDGNTAPTDDTVTAAQQAVAAAETTLENEQTALATAQAALAQAQAAVAAALPTVDAAQTALDAANQEVTKARIQLNTANLRADTAAEIAAQARLDAANAAKDTAAATLNRAQLALQTAQGAAGNGGVLGAQVGVAGAQNSVATETLALGLLSDANAAFDAAAVGDPFTWFTLANPGGASASIGFTYSRQRVPPVYAVGYTDLYYRMDATLPDALHQAIAGKAVTINGAWSEVTYQYSLITDRDGYYNNAAPQEPVVTVALMTESYDPSSAVQQPDGTWLIAGTDRSILGGDPGTTTAPNPPRTVSVLGLASLPSCSVAALQLQGGSATRYGWSEFTVPETQGYARRYRALTASNGPATPAGTSYSGSLRIDTPPPDYDPGNYPPVDPDTGLPQPGLPTIINFLGGQETPVVVIYDTLSDSCGTDRPLPDSLTAVTDGATLTSTTTRVMDSPAGLCWTLSNEITTADIAGQVADALTGAWNTRYDGSLQGAYYYAGADGDFVQAQKMRYKLNHSANDTRVLTSTTFDVTTRWLVRRRNLDTGAVTDTPQSASHTFPVTVPVLDDMGNPILNPDGSPRVNYVYNVTDADWIEIDAPGANESVELVMLPGVNADPHTFGGMAVALALG